MKIQKDYVLLYMKGIQEKEGGYYGTDIANLANELGVTWHGIQKRISFWKNNDLAFKSFVYLGQHRPSITLNEFIEIESRVSSNSLEIKQHILSNLQTERKADGKELITKPTFYRVAKHATLSQFPLDFMYHWFVSNKITIPDDYSVKEARESLSSVFTFSDMKTPRGPNLRAIYNKLSKAKEWFSRYEVEPINHYSKIITQGKHIRSFLTSIRQDQQKRVQARLIFECQIAFIIECTDLLIDMIIRENGRIQRAIDKSRSKVGNHIREESLVSTREDLNCMIAGSCLDIGAIHKLANPVINEKTKIRMGLMRKHSGSYHLILQVLDDLTNSMREGVNFHSAYSRDIHKLFLLAKDKNEWRSLDEEEKRPFIRNSNLVLAIDNGNEDVASLIAIERIVKYIKQGKITFNNSYYYCHLGNKIKNVEIEKNEGFLTNEILEKMVSELFAIDIQNIIEGLNKIDKIDDCDPNDEEMINQRIDFSEVLRKISKHVRAMHPEWFKEHVCLFIKQTDGLFSMEYTEDEFADRLYEVIGFLGRNFRYRDLETSVNLKYFIQRYVTEEQLILELKFIYQCMVSLTGKDALMVVIDTMGINSRKTSILSDYHGRYATIGFADMRSVTPDMWPINSFRCRSGDSEAMNMVEVIDKIQTVCDNSIKIYTGDSHTISCISAGLVFLTRGVVAAGRICKKLKKLKKSEINKLRENIPLLNKIGKLLRDDPSLGRAISMKKHIYIDGINICKLVEDLGRLILRNVSNADIPVDDVCLVVERSNNLKKKARIVEGSYTRVRMNDVGLSLLSGELVLGIIGLYHIIEGQTGHRNPVNFSDIRIVKPA